MPKHLDRFLHRRSLRSVRRAHQLPRHCCLLGSLKRLRKLLLRVFRSLLKRNLRWHRLPNPDRLK
jgi:hypothetical protein